MWFCFKPVLESALNIEKTNYLCRFCRHFCTWMRRPWSWGIIKDKETSRQQKCFSDLEPHRRWGSEGVRTPRINPWDALEATKQSFKGVSCFLFFLFFKKLEKNKWCIIVTNGQQNVFGVTLYNITFQYFAHCPKSHRQDWEVSYGQWWTETLSWVTWCSFFLSQWGGKLTTAYIVLLQTLYVYTYIHKYSTYMHVSMHIYIYKQG